MKARASLPNHIFVPAGFSFAAARAGIKASGRPDLALVEAGPETTAAALFTRNRVSAAPIEVGRASLGATRGRVRAVLVNSGNANCGTGKAGLRAALRCCQKLSRLMGVAPQQVIPSSTGIIGVPLPANKIVAALPGLLSRSQSTREAAVRFARAIMTTDTCPKMASAEFGVAGRRARILGIAKGAGMIHPQLATMLVYLFTDLEASSSVLRRLLRDACEETFNRISIDGDTSTNDTVLLMASGQSRIRVQHGAAERKLAGALRRVCGSLAEQIVADGEGVSHVIRLFVERAADRAEALQVARAVAHSLLVKTAWAGADPNWGRILAAVGRSGIRIDPRQVSILIGDQFVCRRGMRAVFDEKRAHHHLGGHHCDVRIRLGRGRASVAFLTADLTSGYVRINSDYST